METDPARIKRSVYKLMAIIDANYGEFRTRFLKGRATFATGADFIDLGLDAAATIVSSSGTKTVLTAIATAIEGTRVSVDKNFFAEKSVFIIVQTMDRLRSEQRVKIDALFAAQAPAVEFGQAVSAVAEYFEAGTVVGALAALETDAGKKKADVETIAKGGSSAEDKAKALAIIGTLPSVVAGASATGNLEAAGPATSAIFSKRRQ